LIIYAVLFIDLDSNHPGFITLIPVVGTVLIIWFCDEKGVVSKFLSNKLFVGIGLISYSLYIWHYPIFAFGYIKLQEPSLYDKLGWVSLAFLLSILTYFFIEKPFRKKNFISTKSFTVSLIVAVITIITINSTVIYTNGFPSRLPPIFSNLETNVLKSRACEKPFNCTINKGGGDTVFLIGDSHMMPLEKPLAAITEQRSFELITLNKSVCQYILNLHRARKKTYEPNKYCTSKFQQKRRQILLSKESALVIIGGRLPLILEEDRFNNMEGGYEGEMSDILQNNENSLITKRSRNEAIFREYKKTVTELLEHGHKVVLIYPVPEVGVDVPKTLLKPLMGMDFSNISNYLSKNLITTSYAVYLERTRSSFALFDGIKHKNIYRIYPDKIFCNSIVKNRCVTHNNKNSYYRDDNHLSGIGAKLLIDKIVETAFE